MRLYSVAEARQLLPEVVPVLEQVRRAFHELRALRASLALESKGARGDGNLVADPWNEGGEDRAKLLERELRVAVSKLEGWGIELKDPSTGLIDFYHEQEDEVVFLCFRLGERDIEYWHTLSGGFAGRQPLGE